MTEYALAPNSKFTADSPYRTPRVMLEQGLLRAYRVRSNGTMRHLDLLPLDSTKRETAEWISDAVEMDGRSVESVGRELNISTPTVRRFLESLELTEEVEAGDWDDLYFDSAGNPVWSDADEEELAEQGERPGYMEPMDDEPVIPAPQPTRRTRVAVTPEAQAAKDAELLARNQARFAPKADVAGGQCEPEGTPAEEVETVLTTSVKRLAEVTENLRRVGAPEPERTARTALRVPPTGAAGALAVCFCGDQGAHTPGVQGCKNAPMRKARTHG